LSDSDVLAKYRQRILQETEYVHLPGIPLLRDRSDSPTPVRFPLNRLYIRIQALQEDQNHFSEDSKLVDILTTLSRSGEEFYRQGQVYRALERPDPIDPEKMLPKYRRLLILGAPGSGKSTLLQYLAHKAAADLNGPIPIRICLKDYAMYLSTNGNESLQDFAINGAAGGDPVLRQALKDSDHILWLIDALDETCKFRDTIVRQINRLSGVVILTSRPTGYQKIGLEAFAHFEVLTMTAEDVDRFLHSWFVLLSKREGKTSDWVEERAQWFKTELARRPHIQTLAGNPLFLAYLVILFGGDRLKRFPDRRTDLYRYCVEDLLDFRENPSYREALPDELTRKAALDALYYIGWYLHVNSCEIEGNSLFATEVLIEVLNNYLAEQWESAPKKWENIADAVLGFWQQTGILESRCIEDKTYLSFRHSIFREYAAARKMAEAWEKDVRRAWKFVCPRLHHHAWREPILMMAGLLDEEHLNILISRLLRSVSAYERAIHRDLRLSVSLLSENTLIEKHFVKQIIRHLSRLSREHSKKRLITLTLTYLLGVFGILGTFVQLSFSRIFIST